MDKFVAYEASSSVMEKFTSYAFAKSWLTSHWKEGYPLADVSKCFIAEIVCTARVETDEDTSNGKQQHFGIDFIEI
jgi:hypothetical protein